MKDSSAMAKRCGAWVALCFPAYTWTIPGTYSESTLANGFVAMRTMPLYV